MRETLISFFWKTTREIKTNNFLGNRVLPLGGVVDKGTPYLVRWLIDSLNGSLMDFDGLAKRFYSKIRTFNGKHISRNILFTTYLKLLIIDRIYQSLILSILFFLF